MASKLPGPTSLLNGLRAGPRLRLDRHDPAATLGWDKDESKSALADELAAVAELQTRLFAEKRHAVLVVLQAMDAGGKDGVLREVLTGLNPAGVRVTPFGVPSEEELDHDFLWRIHRHTPPRGTIGVFNRSHYEDVLVLRVNELVARRVWSKRYDQIRAFEELLTASGTTVVKLFLNISSEKQRERFQDRIDSPDERWKFRRGDLDDRARWPDFMKAYRDALAKTSTDDAPWYVVPADRKWVRNLVVARILRHTLERIDPRFPPADDDVAGLVVE